jgi:hypothetical protein
MAAVMGNAIASPIVITTLKVSNWEYDPANAARPEPTAYIVTPILNSLFRPRRSPAFPKERERLETMTSPMKEIHWRAARLIPNWL